MQDVLIVYIFNKISFYMKDAKFDESISTMLQLLVGSRALPVLSLRIFICRYYDRLENCPGRIHR